MAQIRIRNTNERISSEQKVCEFLEGQEVVYEHWDTNKLPELKRQKF
jgi:1,2-dihydroxy-3-keto-5-methylthiopentene dioxygenase